jgi:hypothetical protein
MAAWARIQRRPGGCALEVPLLLSFKPLFNRWPLARGGVNSSPGSGCPAMGVFQILTFCPG